MARCSPQGACRLPELRPGDLGFCALFFQRRTRLPLHQLSRPKQLLCVLGPAPKSKHSGILQKTRHREMPLSFRDGL